MFIDAINQAAELIRPIRAYVSVTTGCAWRSVSRHDYVHARRGMRKRRAGEQEREDEGEARGSGRRGRRRRRRRKEKEGGDGEQRPQEEEAQWQPQDRGCSRSADLHF